MRITRSAVVGSAAIAAVLIGIPLGEALFAELMHDLRELVFAHAGEPFGGARPGARVHAHVERAVAHEAETAGRVIELR